MSQLIVIQPLIKTSSKAHLLILSDLTDSHYHVRHVPDQIIKGFHNKMNLNISHTEFSRI